jgi:uncharacterized protein YndB with AHSA1/START domain
MRYEIYIRTTPAALWQAITDYEYTRRYWHGALNRSDRWRGAAQPARFPQVRREWPVGGPISTHVLAEYVRSADLKAV